MNRPILVPVLLLVIPVIVFLGGAWLMNQIAERGAIPKPPLNMRFHYDKAEVETFWRAFADVRRELVFLRLDLVFPLLYGGTLAASLWIARARLGLGLSPLWLLAPVALTVLADWTENLVQLGQLPRFLDGSGVQEGWIRLASAATATKLTLFYGSWIALFLLCLGLLFRTLRGGAS
jgi:hypothetical protein